MAQNNRLLCPTIAQNQNKVAPNYALLAFQVGRESAEYPRQNHRDKTKGLLMRNILGLSFNCYNIALLLFVQIRIQVPCEIHHILGTDSNIGKLPYAYVGWTWDSIQRCPCWRTRNTDRSPYPWSHGRAAGCPCRGALLPDRDRNRLGVHVPAPVAFWAVLEDVVLLGAFRGPTWRSNPSICRPPSWRCRVKDGCGYIPCSTTCDGPFTW